MVLFVSISRGAQRKKKLYTPRKYILKIYINLSNFSSSYVVNCSSASFAIRVAECETRKPSSVCTCVVGSAGFVVAARPVCFVQFSFYRSHVAGPSTAKVFLFSADAKNFDLIQI